jgi:hypothetical protein
MGDKSLMKNIIIALGFITNVVYAEISLQEIDSMIDKIKKPRDGILLEALAKTPDPFKEAVIIENNSTKSIVKKQERDFSLNAIMNNKAFINGRWQKKDDNVSDYKVIFIGNKGVVLSRERDIVKLFLQKNKNDVIKTQGR